MRVLMTSWDFPPADTGAVAVAVKGLAVALTQAGHEVTLVTVASRRAPAEEVVDGVRVLRANAELPWLPDDDVVTRAASANHQLVQLALLARDRPPDVIHAHDWRVAWAADTLSTALRVPLVATFHSTEWGLHAGRVPPGTPATVHSVESWLGHRSDNVATSTRFMVREVTDGFELDPARVHLIPNGIDPSWWTPTSDPPGERRPLVFAWGRVHYEKGFQVLARAINLLRSRVPGIECHIGGRGSYLPELQSQIDVEGVSDLVTLVGFVPHEQLRSIVASAGCVAVPSLYEPFGIVALEALACGAPLVVARTGGLAELVENSGAGLLFEPGNADELAARIEELLTDDALVGAMRLRGQEVLAERYSWPAVAAATVALYSGHPASASGTAPVAGRTG